MPAKTKKQLVGLLFTLLIVVISVLFGAPLQQQTPKQLRAGTYQVISVEDGDTIVVDMNGTEERVRFIGVDTPETRDPRKPVQCFGKAATTFTTELIGDNAVRLKADPTNTNRDRYSRLLRYVYLPDDTLVNAELIRQGYGFAYLSFPVQKAEEFRALEQEARQANRGLWASCEPEQNEYGGYTSNPASP